MVPPWVIALFDHSKHIRITIYPIVDVRALNEKAVSQALQILCKSEKSVWAVRVSMEKLHGWRDPVKVV